MSDMTNIKPLIPGKKYLIRFKYRDPLTGEQDIYHKTLYCTEAEARAHRDEARVQCRRRGKHRPKGERVRDFTDSFLTARATRGRGRRKKPLRAATLERDAFALDDHINPGIGDWMLEAITTEDLEEAVDTWLDKRKEPTAAEVALAKEEKREPQGEPYSIASINQWIKVTRLYLRHAYKRAKLGQSPAEDLENLPTEGDKRGRALTPEEVTSVLDALKEHHGHYWALALTQLITASRFGTASALHVEDIDYDGGLIDLSHSQNEGRRYATSKTGKRMTFPLLPILEEAYAWHRQHLLANEHPGLASGILFPARVTDPEKAAYGGYLCRTGYRNALRSAAKKAGVKPINSHDWRRTLNTWLLEDNVSPELIQSVTGHTTSEMTVHYAHITPEAKARTLAPVVAKLVGRVNEG